MSFGIDLSTPHSKAYGRLDEVAVTCAFFLIRADKVTPSGRHILHLEEVVILALKRELTQLTQITSMSVNVIVKVATMLAFSGHTQHGIGVFLGRILRRVEVTYDGEDDAVNYIAGAFMVDDAARSKLGDGKKPWSAQKVIVVLAMRAPSWEVGGERETREVVTR